MATTIVMPQMGYDMREGTVVRWRKKEGDAIVRGEVIAEIETDKATVEMEAYSAGLLGRIVVEEGRTVPVGELIAVITQPGEPVPSPEALRGKVAAGAPPLPAAVTPVAQGPGPMAPATDASPRELRATPVARRLSREKGIDLAQVKGTGPGGRITEADVLGYEGSAKAVPSPGADLAAASAAAPAPAVALGSRIDLSRRICFD